MGNKPVSDSFMVCSYIGFTSKLSPNRIVARGVYSKILDFVPYSTYLYITIIKWRHVSVR